MLSANIGKGKYRAPFLLLCVIVKFLYILSMEFIKTEITRNVLVVGSQGVGKTTFITKLLYNYTP